MLSECFLLTQEQLSVAVNGILVLHITWDKWDINPSHLEFAVPGTVFSLLTPSHPNLCSGGFFQDIPTGCDLPSVKYFRKG